MKVSLKKAVNASNIGTVINRRVGVPNMVQSSKFTV